MTWLLYNDFSSIYRRVFENKKKKPAMSASYNAEQAAYTNKAQSTDDEYDLSSVSVEYKKGKTSKLCAIVSGWST